MNLEITPCVKCKTPKFPLLRKEFSIAYCRKCGKGWRLRRSPIIKQIKYWFPIY